MTTTIIKSIGTGKDYATFQAFATYVHSLDLVALDQRIIGEVYENLALPSNSYIAPLSYSANNYVTVRPAAGQSVNDLDQTGTLDYGTVGIELTFDYATYQFTIGAGVEFEDFRIKVTGSKVGSAILVARQNTTSAFPNNVKDPTLRRCRCLIQMTGSGSYAFDSIQYTTASLYEDCLFINEGTGVTDIRTHNYALVQRNTFIGRGTGVGQTGASSWNHTGTKYRNNVYVQRGSKPLNRDATGVGSFAEVANNFADTAITGDATGFTVATGLLQGANDYRPATGSPLIGAASASAQNTSDLRKQFRGSVPDVGSAMLTAATLPTKADATITSITVVGQKVTVSGTYTSSFTSVTGTLPAGATPNGAVTATTTVNASGGTFSAVFAAVTPGNYATPQIIFTNQSGAGACTGGTPVAVAVPAMPTVAITGQSKSGQTVTISGTCTGYPTSGTVTLPASATPNGAVTKSASAVFNDNGTFSCTFNAVAYGNYDAPTVSATNATGTANASGTAFTLYAPGTQPVGMAVVNLPPYSAPTFTASTVAYGSEVTSVDIVNASGVDQTNLPFTFAQPFKQGDLAPTDFLLGKTSGADVPLQFNVKATHPDGSVRHAVISGVLPALASGASVHMSMMRTGSTTTTNDPVPPASIASAGFSASATITIGGVVYTADATAALTNGTNIFATWLKGSVCTEYILNIPFSNAGTNHAYMVAQFAVRFFPGVNKARVDISIEATKAYTVVNDTTYDVTLNVGGAAVYTQSALVHFPCARWKKTFYWNSGKKHIKHNVPYLLATKQVPNYDQTIVMSESRLADWANQLATSPDFAPMGRGRFMAAMGTTGGRPEIGLMPDSYAATLISQDQRAKDMMLACADAGSSWSIHRRDDSTNTGAGLPMDVVHWPYSTLLGTTSDGANPATGQNEKLPALNTTSTLQPDAAHEPAVAYVPYLLTGDFYYLEELHFWCSYNIVQLNPGYRNYEQGLYNSGQLRAQGWTTRTLAECAAITPDTHAQKPMFKYILDNNLSFYNSKYTDGNHNALGIIEDGATIVYNLNGGSQNGIAPWQDDHFTSSMGHAMDLGFTEAKRLLNWKGKFQVGRMIAPGYCWLQGSIYSLQIRDTANTPFYPDLATCLSHSISATLNALPCNSQAYIDQLNVERALPSNPYIIGQMVGYANSAEGFPSNLQPALAACVDAGYTDGDLAWSLFDSRSVKPLDYNSEPQYAVLPRTVSSGSAPPDTGLPVMVGALTVSAITPTGFTLSWQAATDNVGVTGYEISLDNGATYVALGNVLSTTKTGLNSATLYNPYVRAYDAAGNRATPLTVPVTTANAPDTVGPAMVGTIAVSGVSTSGFTLSWQAATDNVGVAGYELSMNGGISYASVGNVLSSVQTGLADATSYDVRVRAFDAAGNKSAPLAVTATTDAIPIVIAPDTTPPTMVGVLTVSDTTDTGFTLSWQAATDNIGVIGYELSVNGATYTALGNVLSTSVTGLQASTSYDLRLRALDAAGNRAAPLTKTVTTAPPLSGALTGTYAAPTTHPRMVRVSIDPVPAVAGISSISMATGKPTATQDTSAALDYVFDWAPYLAATNDTILSAEFTVSTGEVSAYDYGATSAIVWFKGGTTGTVAKVVCRIRTASKPQRVDERSIYIKIKDI